MNKLNETNWEINRITDNLDKIICSSSGVVEDAKVSLLADIAKSLAMIADKLCETESEEDK